MKAASLSVNLCGSCNAKCPFCISKMAWKTGMRNNYKLFNGFHKALKYATYHRVDTLLVTGSGEPTLYEDRGLTVNDYAHEAERLNMPVRELQTNGFKIWIEIQEDGIKAVAKKYKWFTHISISAASTNPKSSAHIMGLSEDYSYRELAKHLSDLGFIVRIQLNLNHLGNQYILLDRYTKRLAESGVHQLSLHQIQKPWEDIKPGGEKYAAWIDQYAWNDEQCQDIWDQVIKGGTHLRNLSFGAKVYDYNGLSVAVTHCMDMKANDDGSVRSLILQPDGHVYHHWNYRGSILL